MKCARAASVHGYVIKAANVVKRICNQKGVCRLVPLYYVVACLFSLYWCRFVNF